MTLGPKQEIIDNSKLVDECLKHVDKKGRLLSKDVKGNIL